MPATTTVTSTPDGFEYWTTRPYQAEPLQDELRKAQVLLVPREDLRPDRGLTGPVFPSGTTEFFQFLQERLPTDMRVDIAVADEQYQEVAFFWDQHWFVDVLLRNTALPMFVGVLLEWVRRRIWKPNDSRVRIRLTVEEERAGRKLRAQVTFEGTPDELQPELLGAVRRALEGPECTRLEGGEPPALPPKI